jgi:protein O-GlcNAc transferase
VGVAAGPCARQVKAQGRLAEAIQLYQQALFHNPRSADAMYNLGVAYAEGCEPEKACVCYELAAHFNPRCAEALNNLGVLHKDLDNLPRALSCYEAALRIRPTFPEALNNMGVIYTMMCRCQ